MGSITEMPPVGTAAYEPVIALVSEVGGKYGDGAPHTLVLVGGCGIERVAERITHISAYSYPETLHTVIINTGGKSVIVGNLEFER